MNHKALIIPFTHEGETRYGVLWDGQMHGCFRFVTDAQIFCLEHYVPFVAWI